MEQKYSIVPAETGPAKVKEETEQANISGSIANLGTLGQLVRSEIDIQVATAKAYPRSIRKFLDEARALATLNERVAERCRYVLPRDGKKIEGPSVRLAEILLYAWQNARAGARVIDDAGDYVTAQGFFHDVERNVTIFREVKRRIVTRDGARYSADMVGVTANAACAIAMRNAILEGIPQALWQDILDEARRAILGEVKTLATRRKVMLEEFGKLGIDEKSILSLVGVAGIEDIGLEELATLRGIYTALLEGETTPEDLLPQSTQGQAQKGFGALKDALAAKSKTAEQPPAETAPPNPPGTAKTTDPSPPPRGKGVGSGQ